MLNGKCLILIISNMEFLKDDEGTYLVFRKESEARQYAKKRGLSGYTVVGLLNGSLSDLPEDRPS